MCVSAWRDVPTVTLAGADFKINMVTVWKRRCHVNFNRSPAARMTFFFNQTLWSSSFGAGGQASYAAQKFYEENEMGSVDLGRDQRGRSLGTHTQTFEAFKNSLQGLAKQQLMMHAVVAAGPAAVAPAVVVQPPRSVLWAAVQRFDSEASGGHVPGDVDSELALFVRTRTYQSPSNMLDYYAEQEAKFPAVTRLARRYLCIPSSNVASESLWSLAGYISEDERSTASAELIETQLMVRRNHQECQNLKIVLGIK